LSAATTADAVATPRAMTVSSPFMTFSNFGYTEPSR
jgi:hypothetical protein